jgi:hypothetical protein
VLLGTQGGGLAEPLELATSSAKASSPWSIFASDLNGDNQLDLAVVNNDLDANVSILYGTGNGSFASPVEYSVGAAATSVIAADLNNDTRPDLAVVQPDADFVTILHQQADHSYVGRSGFATLPAPRTMKPGDLNEDGITDIVVGNNSGSFSVWLGAGVGKYQARVDYYKGNVASALALSDLNNDGIVDVVGVQVFNYQVMAGLGNGDGTFGAAVSTSVGLYPEAIALGDLNDDGLTDLAVTSEMNGVRYTSVLDGTGNGDFTNQRFPAQLGGISIALVDVDRDERLDLVVTDTKTNSINVLIGKGDGDFGEPASYPVGGFPAKFTTDDVNQDGFADLVVACPSDDRVSVLLGTGSGTFLPYVEYTTGAYPSSLVVADIDGDGIRDLVVANVTTGSVSLLVGHGDGTFANRVDYAASGAATDPFVTDIDGDGRADVVLLSYYSNIVETLWGACR